MARNLSEIAKDIRSNWKNVYFGAEPYLQAMEQIPNTVTNMDTPILNINEWYIKYQKNPIQAKLELVLIANKEILEAMDKHYYSIDDLQQPNYSEICEWCGFPDFQDGGIFETIIDTAINLAANLNDYKAIQLI